MHHSVFIFISVIALTLCKPTVSTNSGSDYFPVFIVKDPQKLKDMEQLTVSQSSQNITLDAQTQFYEDPELKPLEIDRFPILRVVNQPEQNVPDSKLSTAKEMIENLTTLRILPLNNNARRVMDTAIRKNGESMPYMEKLKLIATKNKVNPKKENELSAKNRGLQRGFRENVESKQAPVMFIDGIDGTIVKNLPPNQDNKEEKGNTKTRQLLEWLYNARPLLSKETKLWGNEENEKLEKVKERLDFRTAEIAKKKQVVVTEKRQTMLFPDGPEETIEDTYEHLTNKFRASVSQNKTSTRKAKTNYKRFSPLNDSQSSVESASI